MSHLGGLALGAAVASLALAVLAPVGVPIHFAHPDAAALGIILPRWSLARWEASRAGLVGAATLIAVPIGAWPVVVLAAVVPSVLLHYLLARRRERASASAIEILHSTHAAMRSGMPLAPALRMGLERVDPAGRAPFETAVRAFELNAGLDAALADARAQATEHRVVVALDALALVAGEQLPASRGAALIASVADRLSFEHRLLEEVRARSGGVRAQIVILALLVPALALYLAMTMPGLGATLATPLGRFVLVPSAAALELAGLLASRAIVRELR